jgi:nicotinamide-nucleotide amidase
MGPVREVVRSRTLRCMGISESHLADLLGDRAREVRGLPVAYLPSVAGIDLRLTTRGMPSGEATELLDAAIAELTSIIGDHVYGENEDDLAEVVLERARARRLRLAVAESCSGGMLGARLTAIPRASDVFVGGVIAYDDDVKVKQLGVDPATLREHGAVSEETVREMASGIRRTLGAQIGVAITGIAGPSGGSPEKPVGLVWMAAEVGDRMRTGHRVYPGNREEIRLRASQGALDLVRRMLRDG